jgi:predicted nucleic acid-binding protein
MRVLLDTCIVLDMLLARSPWDVAADAIWTAGRTGRVECCISSTTVTDIFYIARRLVGSEGARNSIALCLDEATILAIDAQTLRMAFDLGTSDFEDAVQVACYQQNRLDQIVTRDGGFEDLPASVISPAQLMARLQSDDGPETDLATAEPNV